MRSYTELNTKLHQLLDVDGNVFPIYFQAPPDDKMVYPCLRCDLQSIDTPHAGNKPYILKPKYKLMLITKNPGIATEDLVAKLASLESIKFVTHYVADRLHHYVYEIYH